MNIILKICGILLIALQLQEPVCTGHDYLKFSSGVLTLVEATTRFFDSFMDTSIESQSFILTATENMFTNLEQGVDDLLKIAKDNPNVIDLLLERRVLLKDNINLIQHALNECRSKITNISMNRIEDEEQFLKLENEYDLKLKRSYSIIHSIFTHTDIMNALDDYFRADSQVFEHICNTGLSQLQLLEKLVISLTDVTVQFYVARYTILDLIEKYAGRKSVSTKAILNDEVLDQFKEGVNILKMKMREASGDIYACDKRLLRYSAYYELFAFQNYIFNQDDTLPSKQSCKNTPSCRDTNQIVDCIKGNVSCYGVRSCKHALVNCENMTQESRKVFYACVSDDANAIARYSSVVPKERKTDDFSCPSKNEKELSSTLFIPEYHQTHRAWSSHPDDQGVFCEVCNCICPDTIYYISTGIEWTARPNEVLTGARFRMKHNTLYIQVQYGNLLPNARVDEKTLYWSDEPMIFNSTVEISWNGVRAFALTKIILPQDYVLIGLRFENYRNERVRLRSVAQKFNFKAGTLEPNSIRNDLADQGSEELVLSNLDVPIKPITEVKSNDKQFLKFTTTSIEKDGGQTTIPFIENLDVVSEIPVPMGGIGLIYTASAEGYGGFLALKLLSYNVEPNIEIPTELPVLDINAKNLQV